MPKEPKTKPLNKLIGRIPILTPLLKRNFRLLWASQSISLLGDQFHFIALSWLTLQLTGSGLALGTVLMAGAIPRALFMLFGGVLSDRFSPRRIMIISNIARSVVVAVIAIMVFSQIIELWHLYVLSISFGIADSFFHPAMNALIPTVVEKESLRAGNAILQGTHKLSFLIGSAPAGLLISAMGMDIAFGIDSASFVIAAVFLSMMTDTIIKRSSPTNNLQTREESYTFRNIISDIREGLKFAYYQPAFRAMILAIAVIDFCFAGPIDVGLAWLADNRFSGGAAALGAVLSAFGAGAVIGTIIAGVTKFRRPGITLMLICGLLGFGLASFGLLPNVTSAVIISVPLGIGVGIFNIILVTWVQRESPAHMIGRIMSLVSFASVGMMPFSLAIAGLLVDSNIVFMFAVSGGLVLITAVYMLSVPAVRNIAQ